MSKRNISLPPELDEFINQQIESGRYASAGEVVVAGLRVMQEEDTLKELRLQEIESKVFEGMKSLERGEGITVNSALDTLRKMIAFGKKQNHG